MGGQVLAHEQPDSFHFSSIPELKSKRTLVSRSYQTEAKRREKNAAEQALRNLRPESARQLFRSTVAPVVDYASVIWSPGLGKSTLKKIGTQAIIEGFRTVAL